MCTYVQTKCVYYIPYTRLGCMYNERKQQRVIVGQRLRTVMNKDPRPNKYIYNINDMN